MKTADLHFAPPPCGRLIVRLFRLFWMAFVIGAGFVAGGASVAAAIYAAFIAPVALIGS